MPKKSIQFPTPYDCELERIEEIKFYYLTSKLMSLSRGSGCDDQYEIFRIFAQMLGVSENLLLTSISTINTISCKPQELEVAVMAKYSAIDYRTVSKYLMNNRKFHNYIMEYTSNRDENILQPKLQQELTETVISFNELFRSKLAHIFKVLASKVEIEDNEEWNS